MKNILALLYITLFMISCSSGFNPRYYYEKGKRGGLSSSPVIKPVEAPTEVEADKDPFKVGEHNDPNYQFEARKFDSWLFKASFQKDKLPIYNFLTNDSRQWIPGGKDWNNISPAYYYNPKDKENEASGYGITKSTIYKYEGYNPLYDNSGYLPGRMDRFRFYSLYGSAVIVDLQQYLIAVDTYSKLVFAFGKITETKSTFGELVPMKFEAIEYHGDKDFYEYDPIGYVNSDGEVVLYEHYRTEFVKNPTGYLPKQHSFNTVATYTPNGQGYSPYKSIKSTENKEREYKITIEDLYLKNIDAKTVNRYTLGNFSEFTGGIWNRGDAREVFDYAYFGYDVQIGINKRNYNSVANKDSGNGTASYLKRFEVKVGDEIQLELNGNKESTISTESDNIIINVAFNLTKYDEGYSDVNSLYFPYKYSENNNITLDIEFDSKDKSIKLLNNSNNRVIESKILSTTIGEKEAEMELLIVIDGQDGDHIKILDKKNTWGAWYGVGSCGEGATGYNDKVQFRCKLKVEY